MLRQFQWLTTLLLGVIMLNSCEKNDTLPQNETSKFPPATDPIEFKNANLVYFGSINDINVSCYYNLSFYTDMKLDELGNPIGAGQILRFATNATVFDSEPEGGYMLPAGTYSAAASANSFTPFTFNYGYIVQLDLPGGRVEVPDGSFFGDIAQGTTQYDADLLIEGGFTISYPSDGVCRIEGTAVGQECIKRKFIYEGPISVIDRSEGGDEASNSTLTADLDLTPIIKHARLYDREDIFGLGDQSYRLFELRLCGEGFDLDQMWPKGNGQMLSLELFVDWNDQAKNGIPAGTYNIVSRTGAGGIDRANIVPFNMPSGLPDKFEYSEGAWYQNFSNNILTQYARIDSGSMTVTRNGDSHIIAFEFYDCTSGKPYKISGTYSQTTPIDVFSFNTNQ